jgi:Fur family ferric uptake transcriptional regulator
VAFYKLHGTRQHDLLVCLGCDQVQEFADDALEARTRRVAESHEFVLRRYQLILYGYCSRCQAPSGTDASAAARG